MRKTVTPTDASQRMKLIELQTRFAASERQTGPGPEDAMKESLKKALETLPWKIGTTASVPPTDRGATELRSKDLLLLAAGETIELPDAKYPDKKRKSP